MVAEGEKFLSRAAEHGTTRKKAKELWSLIEPFARYGFNKSHAVAYALVAYKTAYLKAHYPVDFLAATLSAEIGSTDGIVKVIGDCVEMGIPVLPPDINESRKAFAGVGPRDPLRPRGRSRGSERRRRRRSWTNARRAASPRSPSSLCDSTRGSSTSGRSTLSSPPERSTPSGRTARRSRRPRRESSRGGEGSREDEEAGQSSLFGGGSADDGPPRDHFPDLPEWSLEDRLKGEKEVLGFYVTGHPLARFAGGRRAVRGHEDRRAVRQGRPERPDRRRA